MNKCTSEDYRSSHIKGRIEYGGLRFVMVKERKRGIPWGKRTALLTDDLEPVALGSNNSEGRGSYGPQTTDDWLALLRQCFPDTDEGRKLLREEIARIVG